MQLETILRADGTLAVFGVYNKNYFIEQNYVLYLLCIYTLKHFILGLFCLLTQIQTGLLNKLL